MQQNLLLSQPFEKNGFSYKPFSNRNVAIIQSIIHVYSLKKLTSFYGGRGGTEISINFIKLLYSKFWHFSTHSTKILYIFYDFICFVILFAFESNRRTFVTIIKYKEIKNTLNKRNSSSFVK